VQPYWHSEEVLPASLGSQKTLSWVDRPGVRVINIVCRGVIAIRSRTNWIVFSCGQTDDLGKVLSCSFLDGRGMVLILETQDFTEQSNVTKYGAAAVTPVADVRLPLEFAVSPACWLSTLVSGRRACGVDAARDIRPAISRPKHANHIEKLLAPLPRDCGLVTWIDGPSATLGWPSVVRGPSAESLGVEHVSSDRHIDDLYRHHDIDRQTPSLTPPEGLTSRATVRHRRWRCYSVSRTRLASTKCPLNRLLPLRPGSSGPGPLAFVSAAQPLRAIPAHTIHPGFRTPDFTTPVAQQGSALSPFCILPSSS